MQSVADRLAETLAKHRVERVFGFPGGGSNLALIDALGRAGIAFVLTRGEVAAAIMAAASAELTGVPGVVVVGNGPGVTSVVNGVAHAHLDRVPTASSWRPQRGWAPRCSSSWSTTRASA